jgi:hypothetical protein
LISGAITRIGALLAGSMVNFSLAAKAHHAQHAHRVFAVARFGFADDAQLLGADVGDAAVVVQHRLAGRIVVHGVDGEVAAGGVFVLLAEGVVAQHAAMFILGRGFGRGATEGGHFEQVLTEHDVHDLEAAADDEGAAEQLLDLFRRGVGGDVEVLGLDAQQQVAHRAADDEGLVAGFLQGLVTRTALGETRAGSMPCCLGSSTSGSILPPAAPALVRDFAARRSRSPPPCRAQDGANQFLDHCAWPSAKRFSTGQPRAWACASSFSLGLVAMGSVTRSISGMSFCESL